MMSFENYSRETVDEIGEQGYNAGYGEAMQKVKEAIEKRIPRDLLTNEIDYDMDETIVLLDVLKELGLEVKNA